MRIQRVIALFAAGAALMGGVSFAGAPAMPPRGKSAHALRFGDATLTVRAAVRPLSSPAGQGSAEPSLALSPEGVVWLSWFETRGKGHALRAARLEGRRWGLPTTIAEGDSFFANWADFPTLLPLGPRHLVAHWPWKSGASPYAYDVRVSQSLDGGQTWSAPVVPHRDGTATEHGFVSMVPDGDGTRLVWLDGRNFAKEGDEEAAGHDAADDEHGGSGEMTLRTAWIGADGSLAEERVLDDRVCDCCQTSAVRTAGGVVVVYRDRDSSEVRDIWAVRMDQDGWGAPYPVARDGWTVPGCPVNGPAIDALDGIVVTAWYTAAGDSERVMVAFSTDGGRHFAAPMQVDEGAPLGRVDVVALADGSAIVTWLEDRGTTARIMARRVRADGAFGSAAEWARTSTARASGFPRVVRAGRTLVLAWTEAGKPSRVRTATLEPSVR